MLTHELSMMPWEMLPPEVFVVVSSLALCGVLLLLTVLTQLHLDSRQRVWRALRVAVGSYLRPGGRTGSDAAAVSSVGKPPGKRARRTERRRQRRAVMSGGTNDELNLRRQAEPQTSSQNSVHAETTAARARETPSAPHSPDTALLTGESSSYALYGQHLQKERHKQRKALAAELQALSPRSLHSPCSGCGIVNAKKSCSYNCCSRCCRNQSRSVCRAHGTGYQAAVESVEGAVQYGYLEFDISYGHLKVCPPRVTAIGTQLVSLNLSNNRLSSLPDDIGVLSNLKELFLQYNNLTQLPESVCSLSQLMEFDVKNNRLTELPGGIGKLRRLVILNITNNHVSRLPASLGRLARLEELGIHSNQLTRLPDEVCNLTSLRVVYGGENRFRSLPSRFGRLWQLQELDVSGCELEVLPESLAQCVSLVTLWLSNNRLQTLPVHIGNLQQLKELHVRKNRLKCLPASVEQLQLYTFTAQNNCFVDERTANEMCHTPKYPVPPLIEMSARAVINYDITWDSTSLPTFLKDMLSRPSRCSVCGGPFFHYFSSLVTFKTVGVFYRVPLYQHFCSPHSQRACNESLL